MKNIKKIIGSALLATAFAATSIGTTFALFTDEAKTTINVQSGIVDVNASLSSPVLYSASSTYTTGDAAGTIATGPFAGTYYYEPQTGLSFANGGEATLANSILGLQRMTPGDKVVASLGFTNSSNVAIKYRFNMKASDDSSDILLSNMVIKIFGNTYTGLKTLRTAWTPLAAQASIAGTSLEVILPLKAGNENQNKSVSYAFSIEAVQGNAITADDEFVSYVTSTYVPLDAGDVDAQSKLLQEKVVEAPLPNATSASDVVTVTVPENAKLENNASSLTLYVENLGEDEDYEGINIQVDQGAENYEVTLEGLAEGNTQPVTVSVNLGYEPQAVYHTHNNVSTSIPFTYDEDTGITTFTVTNFSEFTFLRDTDLIEVPNVGKLKLVRDYVNDGHSLAGKTVVLLANLDLGNEEWTPIGTKTSPFAANFDGRNHTISNFKVTGIHKDTGNAALFSNIKGKEAPTFDNTIAYGLDYGFNADEIAESKFSCVFKNLTVSNATILSKSGVDYRNVAPVIGSAENVLIKNITVTGNTNVQVYKYGAGIAGTIKNTVIDGCLVDENVVIAGSATYGKGDGGGHVAGIAANGQASSLIIANCINKATLSLEYGYAGGIGALFPDSLNFSTIIYNCKNYGSITCSESAQYVGGIMGQMNGGVVANCTNEGALSGSTTIVDSQGLGGIASYCVNHPIYFINCTNEGNISSSHTSNVAGIVSYSDQFYSTMYNCHNEGTLTFGGGTAYQLSKYINQGIIGEETAQEMTTAQLQAEIDNFEGATLTIKNITVSDVGTIVVPAKVTSLTIQNHICNTLQLSSGTARIITIDMPGDYSITNGASNVNVVLRGHNNKVTLPAANVLGVVTLSGSDMTFVNKGTAKGVLFYDAGHNYVLENEGTLTRDSEVDGYGHVVSAEHNVNVVIHNKGTIQLTKTEYAIYPMLFYTGSNVTFNAYAGSLVYKQSESFTQYHVGYLLACYSAGSVTFNYEDGANLQVNTTYYSYAGFQYTQVNNGSGYVAVNHVSF